MDYLLDNICECAFVRPACTKLHCAAAERLFSLGGKVLSALPPYSHVEQALRNDVVHAFSKVLR